MGCFTACFCSLINHRRTKKSGKATQHKHQQNLSEIHEINEALLCTANQTEEEAQVADAFNYNAAFKENNEDQLSITFDLYVKTPEGGQVREGATNSSVENDDKGKWEESKDELVKAAIICSNENGEEKAKREEIKDKVELVSDSSVVSSVFSYPPNFSYQNCASSDDECVDMDFNQRNSAEKDFALVHEESSESLFSLSIDSRKQNSAVDVGEKEVCSSLKPPSEMEMEMEMNDVGARDRSNCVQSVLNPIENLTQWKAVRAKTTSPMAHQEKENILLEQELTMPFNEKDNLNLDQENAILPSSEEPSFKKSSQQRSMRFSKDDEVRVDTSLSSWLMGSEKTLANENSPGSVGNISSKRTKSPKIFEDRPILGALTVEELKQMSKASSPSTRRSPSHSPDEMPIIGTVGSYWRHTGEAMDADFGSSGKGTSSASSMSRNRRKGGMNSTPFQTRLERALEGGVAQV